MAITNKDANAVALATAAAKSGTAPVYAGTYEQQVKDAYDKIANRQKFKYDVNGDALYQTYKDKYIQGGKLAMRDTMGQAAALTGGYGSSYGQAVGQQQYDAYLQQLNDIIPELYNLAYQQYSDEGDALQKEYAMLGDLAADEYSKYRDTMSDYQYDQAWQAQQEETAYQRQLQEQKDAYQKEQDTYTRQKDAYTKLYNLIGSTGYQPSSEELNAAGMSSAAAKALRQEYLRTTGQLPAASSGGGGGGGGYYSVPKTDNEVDKQIADMNAENPANAGSQNDKSWKDSGLTQQEYFKTSNSSSSVGRALTKGVAQLLSNAAQKALTTSGAMQEKFR